MKETMNPTESQSDGIEPSDQIVARANELYWHSEESVNQLARELDLSKGTLYEILAPLPAGLPCPHNDGSLSYPNRTARDRGFVSCATCGFEDEEDQVRALLELQDDLQATELSAPGGSASALGGPAAAATAAPGEASKPDAGAAQRSPTASRDATTRGGAALRPHPPRPRRLETLVAVSVLAGLTAGLALGGLLRRR